MSSGAVDPYPSSGYRPEDRPAPDLADVALAAVAGAGDAIFVLDARGRVVLWNAGCEALFGWTAQEMHGRSPGLLVPPHRRPELLRVLHLFQGRREAAALETERVHKLGELRPVTCRMSPVHDPQGALLGVSAVVRDNSREVELRRQLEHARHLAEARFEQSVVAQATLTPDGVIIDANPALCELSGHPHHRLLGTRVTDHMAAFDLATVTRGLARLASGTVPGSRHPQLLRHADGRLVETRVSIFPVRGDLSPEVLRLEAVVEDVSDTAAAQRELSLREARWESLAAHSADVGLFCDAEGRVLFATPAVESVFGYARAEAWGSDGSAYVHPADVERLRARWRAVVGAPPGTCQTLELRLRHADGSWRWVEQSLTNQLRDPDVQAVVVNLVDVSARKSAETVLEEVAGVDTLTGLATRAPLMASLDVALSSRGASTAVLVVDVAELSLVNDRHGQLVGDAVLGHVGDRLVATAGGRGLVARLAGDRFAVLLPDAGDVGDVLEEALRHLLALQEPLTLDGLVLHPGAAVGGALGPALSSGALVASAEAALHEAKQGLTGPVHVVRAETESVALARARLLNDLRRGIAARELVLHFQPVVSLSTGRPSGAEALLRWQHPDKGLLTPGAFLDVLEGSSLVLEVGREVLAQACRAAARWRPTPDGRPFTVAVNLSARQLTHPGMVHSVRAALEDAGLPPDHLVLEVTESALMSDVAAAAASLQELRDLGVSVAIDDFGTGYSSLTYLKQFPATSLKIDRSFVSGLGRNDADAVIVASVLDLARAMGLECVAEGVETEQQRLALQALGCPAGQGYLWAPALALPAFEAWLGRTHTDPPREASRPEQGDARGGGRPARGDEHPPGPSAVAGRSRAASLARGGASLHTIAAALNGDGLTTSRGKRWTPRSVAELLAGDDRP